MVEANDILELSAAARARQQGMLPGLLAAVRWRRRRRLARRAVAGALLVVVATALLGPWWRAPAMPEVGPVAAAPRWSTFGDDPTVLERCTVQTPVRAAWFVDDAGLQGLLAAADRPAGLVRVRDRVLVSAAAVDRWEAEAP